MLIPGIKTSYFDGGPTAGGGLILHSVGELVAINVAWALLQRGNQRED